MMFSVKAVYDDGCLAHFLVPGIPRGVRMARGLEFTPGGELNSLTIIPVDDPKALIQKPRTMGDIWKNHVTLFQRDRSPYYLFDVLDWEVHFRKTMSLVELSIRQWTLVDNDLAHRFGWLPENHPYLDECWKSEWYQDLDVNPGCIESVEDSMMVYQGE